MIIEIGKYWYELSDKEPKLNEWYVNTFATDWARSMQVHTHIRDIKNHKKEYRFRYCKVVIASNDPKFKRHENI